MPTQLKNLIDQFNARFPAQTASPKEGNLHSLLKRLLETISGAANSNDFQSMLSLHQSTLSKMFITNDEIKTYEEYREYIKALLSTISEGIALDDNESMDCAAMLFVFLHNLGQTYLLNEAAYITNKESKSDSDQTPQYKLNEFLQICEDAKEKLKFTFCNRLATMTEDERKTYALSPATQTFFANIVLPLYKVIKDEAKDLAKIKTEITQLRTTNPTALQKCMLQARLRSTLFPENFMQVFPAFIHHLRHIGLPGMATLNEKLSEMYAQHAYNQLLLKQLDRPVDSHVLMNVTSKIAPLLNYFLNPIEQHLSSLKNDLARDEKAFNEMRGPTTPLTSTTNEIANSTTPLKTTTQSPVATPIKSRNLSPFLRFAEWAARKLPLSFLDKVFEFIASYFPSLIKASFCSIFKKPITKKPINQQADSPQPVIAAETKVETQETQVDNEETQNQIQDKINTTTENIDEITRLKTAVTSLRDLYAGNPNDSSSLKLALKDLSASLERNRHIGFDQDILNLLRVITHQQPNARLTAVSLSPDQHKLLSSFTIPTPETAGVNAFKFELKRLYNELFNAAFQATSGYFSIDIKENRVQKSLGILQIFAGQVPMGGNILQGLLSAAKQGIDDKRLERLLASLASIAKHMLPSLTTDITLQFSQRIVDNYPANFATLDAAKGAEFAQYLFSKFQKALFETDQIAALTPKPGINDAERITHWVDVLYAQMTQYTPSIEENRTPTAALKHKFEEFFLAPTPPSDSLKLPPQRTISYQLDHKEWAVNTLCMDMSNILLKLAESGTTLLNTMNDHPNLPWIAKLKPDFKSRLETFENTRNTHYQSEVIQSFRKELIDALKASITEEEYANYTSLFTSYEQDQPSSQNIQLSESESAILTSIVNSNQILELLTTADLGNADGLKHLGRKVHCNDAQKKQLNDLYQLFETNNQNTDSVEYRFIQLLKLRIPTLDANYIKECKSSSTDANRNAKENKRNALADAITVFASHARNAADVYLPKFHDVPRADLTPKEAAALSHEVMAYDPKLKHNADYKVELSLTQRNKLVELKKLFQDKNCYHKPGILVLHQFLLANIPHFSEAYIDACLAKSKGDKNIRQDKVDKRNAIALVFTRLHVLLEKNPSNNSKPSTKNATPTEVSTSRLSVFHHSKLSITVPPTPSSVMRATNQ